MNYIDFAIAVSVFLFFFTMTLILSTNYFSDISGLIKISEFRSVAEGISKLIFGIKGVPEDWEKTLGLNPVQLGLIGDLYRVPVLAKENSGYNRTNELVSVNIIFDEDCENKSWNDTTRVFDENGNEIPFRMSKESFCHNQFLKEGKVVWETNLTANQNRKFYVYYSSDDSINIPNYTDPFSTVAYWHFDEGSDNYTFDESGNHNTGILKNGTGSCDGTACPSWVSGIFGQALEFDYIGDYVEIPFSQSLNITDELTVEAWVNLNNIPDNRGFIITKHDWHTWALHYDGEGWGREFGFQLNSKRILQKTGIPQWGDWYHVAVTFSDANDTAILYVNGSAVATNTSVTDHIPSGADNFYIGRGYLEGYYLVNGTIDEVRIWNRALSSEEINASFISGPIPIKPFPEENLNSISSSKINALKNLDYEDILKTFGDYKFRIEISEGE